ncbi:helix-turn-helix domain-containing protein [Kamptonema formosum]|nr:helix-turn-helix domain-containing protein [Kamptonema formosum]
MKVNYQERIDLSVGELKIILSQQRTITNRQKIQALYWLKAGLSPSLTDVAERLGVHRITVNRWLKQYWCQDETRIGLKTIERKRITALGVKPIGKVQWNFKAY